MALIVRNVHRDFTGSLESLKFIQSISQQTDILRETQSSYLNTQVGPQSIQYIAIITSKLALISLSDRQAWSEISWISACRESLIETVNTL